MALGSIIYGGGLGRMIYAFESAGRGAAGYDAAVVALLKVDPHAAPNTIAGAIDFMRETLRTGTNYRRGGPDYSPGSVPDARPAEGRDPEVPPAPEGSRRQSGYIHEGVIEIIDPNRDDAVIQRFGITGRFDDVMSRSAFERWLNDQGQSFFDRFISYDDTRLPEYDLHWRFRIEGVYRGF